MNFFDNGLLWRGLLRRGSLYNDFFNRDLFDSGFLYRCIRDRNLFRSRLLPGRTLNKRENRRQT